MDASLGLGASLVYLTSDDPAKILAQVRRDSHLRRQVHARLKACAHRARTIISQHHRTIERLASALAHRQSITAADLSILIGPDMQPITGSNGVDPGNVFAVE
jgi:ATP-dependent Zn protease